MTLPKFLVPVLRRWYLWAFLAAAVLDWMILTKSVIEHPFWVLSIFVVLAIIGWLFELVRTAILVADRTITAPVAVARWMMLTGLVSAFGFGVGNWLWSLQGYVVLKEREAMPLHGGSHLLAFEAGPISDPASLDLTLQLEELTLVPTSEGGLYTRSRLRIKGPDGKVTVTDVSPKQVATYGSLRFYQGAWGFAPRIVILSGDETVFDEVVPFMTRVHDRGAYLSFEEAFTIEDEELEVRSGIDLSSLDEGLRGHAMLAVSVRKADQPLGEGRLSVGHFAEIGGGYRIGFAGLERWSEIDFSRRNYRRQMVWGFGLFLAGLAAAACSDELMLLSGPQPF
jgi:hypothetical protein